MIISRNMNLDMLAERIGGRATVQDAARFRDLLCETGHVGMDVKAVDAEQWHDLLDKIDGETL